MHAGMGVFFFQFLQNWLSCPARLFGAASRVSIFGRGRYNRPGDSCLVHGILEMCVIYW